MVGQACYYSTWEMEVGGSEVKDCLWLHNESEVWAARDPVSKKLGRNSVQEGNNLTVW